MIIMNRNKHITNSLFYNIQGRDVQGRLSTVDRLYFQGSTSDQSPGSINKCHARLLLVVQCDNTVMHISPNSGIGRLSIMIKLVRNIIILCPFTLLMCQKIYPIFHYVKVLRLQVRETQERGVELC